jgi:hypothetical protein
MRKKPPAALPPPGPEVQVRYVTQSEPARIPAPVLALETIGRMPPATAVTLILTTAATVGGVVTVVVLAVLAVVTAVVAIAGMVALGAVGISVAAILLGGQKAPPTR